MRLLLDTHVLLWAAGDCSELRAAARDAIADPENELYVSAAASWEMAIKVALGKLRLPAEPIAWFHSTMREFGARSLPITPEHAFALLGLPSIHRDPFDRMMIAQAQIERLTFVTRDPRIAQYAVHILAA